MTKRTAAIKLLRRGRERDLWRGRQWSVTTRGIQGNADGDYHYYFVSHDRLDENERHGWPEHMAGKHCDLEDFIEAFRIACLLTNTNIPDLDEKLARARAIKKRGEEYDARIEAEMRALGYVEGELCVLMIGDDGHFHPIPKVTS